MYGLAWWASAATKSGKAMSVGMSSRHPYMKESSAVSTGPSIWPISTSSALSSFVPDCKTSQFHSWKHELLSNWLCGFTWKIALNKAECAIKTILWACILTSPALTMMSLVEASSKCDWKTFDMDGEAPVACLVLSSWKIDIEWRGNDDGGKGVMSSEGLPLQSHWCVRVRLILAASQNLFQCQRESLMTTGNDGVLDVSALMWAHSAGTPWARIMEGHCMNAVACIINHLLQ